VKDRTKMRTGIVAQQVVIVVDADLQAIQLLDAPQDVVHARPHLPAKMPRILSLTSSVSMPFMCCARLAMHQPISRSRHNHVQQNLKTASQTDLRGGVPRRG